MDSFDDTGLALMKFGVGQPVSRKEDPTLLRGQGRYTDDTNLAGQASALPDTEEAGFFDMFDVFSDTPGGMLERAFTAKAELAASGQEPAPEAAPDATIQPVLLRLD